MAPQNPRGRSGRKRPSQDSPSCGRDYPRPLSGEPQIAARSSIGCGGNRASPRRQYRTRRAGEPRHQVSACGRPRRCSSEPQNYVKLNGPTEDHFFTTGHFSAVYETWWVAGSEELPDCKPSPPPLATLEAKVVRFLRPTITITDAVTHTPVAGATVTVSSGLNRTGPKGIYTTDQAGNSFIQWPKCFTEGTDNRGHPIQIPAPCSATATRPPLYDTVNFSVPVN
jgi:hypothetical protein